MDIEATHSLDYTYVSLAPNEQIPLHSQDSWELSYVIVGSGIRQIGYVREPFNAGEIVLIPPEIPHCWNFDRNVTDKDGRISNITLIFKNAFLDKCVTSFPELSPSVLKLRETSDAIQFCTKKAERLISILEAMRSETDAERIASAISILIALTEDGSSRIVGRRHTADPSQERMDRIRTYVICNATRPISLYEISKHVGMNRSSFCIFFKKMTGKTFVTFLNEYRIGLACDLLEKRASNISQICYSCGFNDTPYFNRLFKRTTGLTPFEYASEHGRKVPETRQQ
jgi:AraC-type DNA-binding domain-containing proteins